MFKLKLIVIFLLAFILRTVYLTQTPSGFHADEASFYINALSISQTGTDESGNKLPLSINSFIDPKPALYSYFQIPSLIIFDNQIFAARFPSVVLALLSLVATYYLIKKLANKKIALLTTLVLTISPWHIIVSRGTQEVIASFLFLVTSLLLLVLYLQKEKINKVLLLSAFTLSSFLSMYFYHSAKVILPLLIFGLLAYFYKNSKSYLKNIVVATSLIIVSGVFSLLVQESSSRIAAVSIFSDMGVQEDLMEQIFTLHETVPLQLTRIFYNKGEAYFIALSNQYLEYFSPKFLFSESAKPTRYVVPNHGLLYLIEAPLLLLGLYFAIRSKKKEALLFLGLLFLSPIPAALTTQETPSMIRSFPMVISLAYFIAVGIQSLCKIKNKPLKILILLGTIFSYLWFIGYFAIQYHVQAYFDLPFYRNSPYMEIAKEVKKIGDSYDEVHVTNDLRPLYSYFVMENLISIEDLQANPYIKDSDIHKVNKFTFNRDVCAFESIKPGVLYIAEKECRKTHENLQELELVKNISYQDGNIVYELLQVAQ